MGVREPAAHLYGWRCRSIKANCSEFRSKLPDLGPDLVSNRSLVANHSFYLRPGEWGQLVHVTGTLTFQDGTSKKVNVVSFAGVRATKQF